MQSEYESLVQGIRQCSACSFRNPRIEPLAPVLKSVPVSIMFIGENPSWAQEQRIPFAESTPSGQALEENYLRLLQLSRSEVWITDLFKCRYPKRVYDAKTQHGKEIQNVAETCSRLWLLQEIEFAKPRVIVTLANKEVYQRLRRAFGLSTPQAFADAVGKPHQVSWDEFAVTLFPMVHPYISRPLGQGDQRRAKAREKWATIHQQEHIPALKKVLQTHVL